MNTRKLKISILGTVAESTLIFRRDLIADLVASGHEVTVFCVDYTEQTYAELLAAGAIPINYSLSRSGLNPFADLVSIWQLRKLFRQIKPNIVLSCFVKPSIYGSIAARLAGVPKRIAMLEGLGFVFTDLPNGITVKQQILRKIQIFLYRLALPSIDKIIFLNPDDPIDLLEKNKLKAKSIEILGGIGVDLKAFPYSDAPSQPVRFIFIARLLAEKGIFEYIKAAKEVKSRHPQAEFVVLGSLDEANPGSLKQNELQELINANIIIHPGHVTNVAEWVASSSVFVLPSYYREGVPRSTQEAMAIGRAVITTDVPGCRETVKNNINGFLIPKWNSSILAERMLHFIEIPSDIHKMGKASYRIAIEKFDVRIANTRLIKILTK